ncbi:MAG: hypothetical protein AB1393_10305 [Candidatus Edwardsbacteria bacterium]
MAEKKAPSILSFGIVISLWFLILLTGLGFFLSKSATPSSSKDDPLRQANQEIEKRALVISKQLAQRAKDGLLTTDEVEREILLEPLVKEAKEDNPDLTYFLIADSNRKISAHIKKEMVGEVYTPPPDFNLAGKTASLLKAERQSKNGEKSFEIIAPVMMKDRPLGFVALGLPLKGQIANVGNTKFSFNFLPIGMVGLLGIIGTIFLMFLANKKVHLATATEYDETDARIELRKQEEAALLKRIENARKTMSDLENLKRHEEELKTGLEEKKKEDFEITYRLEGKRKELQEAMQKLEEKQKELSATPEQRMEALSKEEIEMSERLSARKREEMALAQKIEEIRKKVIDLDRRIEARRREELEIAQRVEMRRREEMEIAQRIEARKASAGMQ